MQIDRRIFLAGIALPLYPATPLQTFSAAEARIIEALCAQIIPADDSPGAREAGVLYYIDKQLAGPLNRYAGAYRRALPKLQGFAELSPQTQASRLHEIETGGDKELAGFFQLVIDHVMQGFYGSPQHGGNRDEASWKMLGIQDVMGGHRH